jgi:hypothetical protein
LDVRGSNRYARVQAHAASIHQPLTACADNVMEASGKAAYKSGINRYADNAL